MLAVQTKAYKIFNWLTTAVNGVLVLIFIALYLTENLSTSQLGLSVWTTIIGSSHLVYMFSFYRPLTKRSMVGASLIGSVFFISNIAVLVLSTGGFSSPYYALWLILVLAIGIYRPSVPVGLLGLTTLYFVSELLVGPASVQSISSSAISLAATYLTGSLGFWLWHTHHTRLRKTDDTAQLSQALSTEQLKSEVLLNHIGEGVIVTDKHLLVQLLNPAGSQLTGWTANEAKGIDSHLVLRLSDSKGNELKGEDGLFEQAMSGKKSITRDDVIVLTRSEKKLALSITVSPIFSGKSDPTGAIAVFRDISQAKGAERQRNEFISTASHEMRTPVAAVEGYIALALNPKVSTVDENAIKYLKKAQAATQHLGKLFQDLLAITRIEEGKLPNHPEVIEVSSLIGELIDEFKFKVEKTGLKLTFQAASQKVGTVKSLNPIYYVYADPERVREVLINLVDNAIKFTPQGNVAITLDGDDKQVIIGVKDTGIGIAPEDIPHLFQKFYRIDNSQTRDIGGTGLGLYITRAIVEFYQGRIWVETTPGKGSHFKISLPRLSYEKAQQMLAKQKAKSEAEPPKSKTEMPASQSLVASSNELQVE